MKKAITILCASALLLSLAACSEDATNSNDTGNSAANEFGDYRDTPVRVSTQGGIRVGMDLLTFDSTTKQADLIADVTIIGWLGETFCEQGMPMTYFLARINNTAKGNEYETIVLIQGGNSELTVGDHPLFRQGDRLFLFMGEMQYDDTSAQFKAESENLFCVIGLHLTPFIVQEHEKETYLFSFLDWGIAHCLVNDSKIRQLNEKSQSAIAESYFAQDPVLKELGREIDLLGFAFNYSDVVGRIERTVGA